MMMEKALVVSLLVVCAYLNALFLASPIKAFRKGDYKGIAVLIGMLTGNLALILWLDFDLLITLVAWLPAIAGVLARKLFGRQET
jgi:predicted membrane channel-forming protein YqfA (hemolysin III family)